MPSWPPELSVRISTRPPWPSQKTEAGLGRSAGVGAGVGWGVKAQPVSTRTVTNAARTETGGGSHDLGSFDGQGVESRPSRLGAGRNHLGERRSGTRFVHTFAGLGRTPRRGQRSVQPQVREPRCSRRNSPNAAMSARPVSSNGLVVFADIRSSLLARGGNASFSIPDFTSMRAGLGEASSPTVGNVPAPPRRSAMTGIWPRPEGASHSLRLPARNQRVPHQPDHAGRSRGTDHGWPGAIRGARAAAGSGGRRRAVPSASPPTGCG